MLESLARLAPIGFPPPVWYSTASPVASGVPLGEWVSSRWSVMTSSLMFLGSNVDFAGSALAPASRSLLAISLMSPVPASTLAPSCDASPASSRADVLTSMTLNDTDTAKETVVAPPAPEVVSDSKLCAPSSPTLFIVADPSTPSASMTAPLLMSARFLTLTRLNASAAPTANDPPLLADSPSALALPSLFADDARVSLPPLTVMCLSAGTDASAVVVTRLKATAAATVMAPPSPLPPPELPSPVVFAFGVDESFAVPVWLLVEVVFAEVSCLLPLSFGVSPSLGWLVSELSVSAPVALATAVLVDEDCCFAVKETSPPAVRSRCVVALDVWLALTTATEAPIAAEVPSLSPVAVVSAFAVWSAVALSAPPTVSSDPVPSPALVVTLEIETATTGVSPMLPAEPDSASVDISSSDFAESVTSWALVSDALLPTVALDKSLTTLTETPRPMPKPVGEDSISKECIAPVALDLSRAMHLLESDAHAVASDADFASINLVAWCSGSV